MVYILCWIVIKILNLKDLMQLIKKNRPIFYANRNSACKCTEIYRIYGYCMFLTAGKPDIYQRKRIGKSTMDLNPSIQKPERVTNNYWNWPVTRQLRWRTEASGWAASAACSHHPTTRVGHSRGFTAIRTSYVGTKTARYTHARGRISTAWRTSLNSRDDYCGRGSLWRITWRRRRTRGNVATPEVHQRGEDVRLFQPKQQMVPR